MNIFKKIGFLYCLTTVFVFSVNSGQDVSRGKEGNQEDLAIQYLK